MNTHRLLQAGHPFVVEMLHKVSRFVTTSALVLCTCQVVYAQDVTKSFIRKLDYYKYSSVSIFEADAAAAKRFKEKFTPTPQKTPAIEQAEQDCPTSDDIKKKIKNKQQVPQSMIDEAPNECETVRNYYKLVAETIQIGKVYVLTEKYQDGSEPAIIGAVSIPQLAPAQAADPEAIKSALNSPLSSGVLDVSELRGFKTVEQEASTDPNNPGMVDINGSITGTSYSNMYDYFKAMIKQNPQDKVSAIRPTQTVAMKINKEVVTKMLSEDRVADYQYISDGEPHKTGESEKTFTNEVIIGLADYFSWRLYDKPEDVQGEPTNLPRIGVELRAGLEEIGFPSLWSERWTANAIWQSNKLGVILPTTLWSSQITPIFTNRRFTYGPAGINASFDFPFKLIDRSGVFNVSGSYAFGENVQKSDYGVPETTGSGTRLDTINTRDYFVRGHAQVNYTFAIGINDPDRETQVYFIRFKLGAAGYIMDTYRFARASTEAVREQRQFRGDFLARIEYMGTGLAAPFGAYVQYFDGALSGNAWLQVPISQEGFFTGFRLEGKIFAPVTRGPQPWENQVVIMPALRFIFRW
jgi:hypothetical protein